MAAPRSPDYTIGFPATCNEPWAQVTMMDASHGDAHVVDLCVVQPDATNSYPTTPDRSYHRTLLDTGPPGDAVFKNLLNVLINYGQPTLTTTSRTISLPQGWDEGRVDIFELTHVDNDHCGNAVPLMKRVLDDVTLRKSFTATNVLYHQFPLMNPSLSYELMPRSGPFGPDPNRITIREHYPGRDWVVQHQEAGFQIKYHFKGHFMVKVDDPFPAWTDPAFGEKVTLDNICPIEILQYQCARPPPLAPFGAVCVSCQLILTRTGKLGKLGVPKARKVATAHVEVVMPNSLVQKNFFLQHGYRLNFTTTNPDERATIRDFQLIRDQLDAIQKNAVATGTTWAMAATPRQWTETGSFISLYNTELKLHIMGPLRELYHDFIGDSMQAFYESNDVATEKLDPGNYDIANRASIISLFSRPSAVLPDTTFRMLFTRRCVPHHGSDVTAEAEFYRYIRARVYLISGQQSRYGAPALKTLLTIAEGFRQDPGTYSDKVAPHYLFFSDARTLDPVAGRDSNTKQLLASAVRPNIDNTNGKPIYNYQCYRIKRQDDSTRTAGRILFGANKVFNAPWVWFGEASGDSDTDTSHDWVRMG
ncbi:uncharacterized protein N7477_009527 [Penicillium maclennaniae]|uniref:uncharacterized protein n=1 Tax=Penicillium maclennaniae TaxID=1343394 RepID=UPI0025422F11|nr:uncharacterized protein N7477_009527 [Penicillium maclennaniae]KAJ5661911.1 hypothetical protein N7477_009527 [Penicillium maclennaniae]